MPVRQSLEAFFTHHFGDIPTGHRIEIRAFPAAGGGKKVQEFFATPAQAAAFVATLEEGLEIYYGVNPRRGNNGTKEGVAEVVCLQADVDDKHFGNDPEASHDACYGVEDIPPSEVIRSGHGWQAIWLLEEPVGSAEIDRVENLLRRLYFHLGGLDAVQDVSRIFRVPGTWNNKNPQHPQRVELASMVDRCTTLAEMERVLPVLPPREQPGYREVAEVLGEDQRPSLEYLRLLLSYIDPLLPYNEYILIWGGVAYYYPGPEGLALVDEWSSEKRAANGQYSSPRTQPEKHKGFRRQTGRVATIGTLIHYAKKGGYVIEKPALVLPTIGQRKRQQQPEAGLIEKLDNLPNPTYLDLPFFVQKVYDYLGELAEVIDRDFITQMALVGFSQFWSGVRIQGLPLNLWGLGVAESGSGKNVVTDMIRELYCAVPSHAPLYTSGSPEGILRAMDGDGKTLFIYLDEFGDFLAALGRDYMSGTAGMLCSLHDGRPIAHRLTKQSLLIENPFAAMTATTTPEKIRANLRQEDLDGGLFSRFWVTLPKTSDRRIRKKADLDLRAEIAEALLRHRQDLGAIRQCEFYTELPDEQVELEREIGINTGTWRTFEDALRDPRVAQTRHLSRWMVQAALLEFAKARPAIYQGNLLVTRESCQLSLALTRRAIVDQERLASRLAGSEDGRSLDRIRRAVDKGHGLTRSDLLRTTKLRAQELSRLLDILTDSREIAEEIDDGGRTLFLPITGRTQSRKTS